MREINTTGHKLGLKTKCQQRSDNYCHSRHANSIFCGFLVKEVSFTEGSITKQLCTVSLPYFGHVDKLPKSNMRVTGAYYFWNTHDRLWRFASYSSAEIFVVGLFLHWYLGRNMGK